MFLRNSWYAAAFDHEVGQEPFARTILGEPIVLYRKSDNTAAALADSCCHRALPLSMGTVIGDDLRCGYHGLVFDADGACVSVPGQSTVPPGASVRSYPAIERFGWIWVWTGDPALADPALLPDWHWLESPDWKMVEGNGGKPLPMACNYELISDNLFDLTHLSYVHATTIGTDAIVDFPCKTERLERSIRMSRLVVDRPAAPFYQWCGRFEGNVDRWLITTVDMPSFIVNHAGCVDTGTGIDMTEGRRDGGVELKVLNALTPETETSTHYFYGHTRNFRLDEEEVTEKFRTNFTQVFLEDKAILEAQQAMISNDPDAPRIDVNADAPCIQVRKLLRELIAAESGDPASIAAE